MIMAFALLCGLFCGIYGPYRAINIWKTQQAWAHELIPFFGMLGSALFGGAKLKGGVARIAAIMQGLVGIVGWFIVVMVAANS
jgi:hypothetical protein